ncbi:MAG: calcium-binding protein [Albidovulum sp.]|uniref:EF-hand domain-containing protein n=1 Tax=Albidovulum sp. TaxID=1872424 RepID=UPI003CBB5B10
MKLRASLATTAVLLGAAAVAVPTLVTAHDRGGMRGGMMGGAMMGGFDFAAVDADGDGKITQAEIDAHRKASVAGFDSDGDGMISKEEATAFATAKMQAHITAMIDQQFAMRDLDGDGKLSAVEIVAPPAHTRLFDRADADGDGAVSEAEFSAMQERMQGKRGQGFGKGGRSGWHGHPMGGWFGWGDTGASD